MIRNIVIVLDLLLGAAAAAGGVYLLLGARGLPQEWLSRSAVRSLRVPGLILLVLVGGSLFAAAGLLLAEAPIARLVSVEAGIVFLGWSAVQWTTIGYRHWLQVVSVALGVAVVVLSLALPAPG